MTKGRLAGDSAGHAGDAGFAGGPATPGFAVMAGPLPPHAPAALTGLGAVFIVVFIAVFIAVFFSSLSFIVAGASGLVSSASTWRCS